MSTDKYLAELKRASESGKDLEYLTSQLEKLGGKDPAKTSKSYEDTRFWKPTVDKAGNGFSVIRFLDRTQEDRDENLSFPWVQTWSHAFQGPTGKWYIENCLSTINQTDPVNELNSKLWNSGVEANKDIARKQKRKLSYIANIYVVKDPANPENEGKVFLFKYGKKIQEKIEDLMKPQFADEAPVNPFDYFKGADFKLKIRNLDGYRNYDKSEFDNRSLFLDGDIDELKSVMQEQYSLKEFVSPENFKTYEELQDRLHAVLGDDLIEDYNARSSNRESFYETPKKIEPKIRATVEEDSDPFATDDDDDGLTYFEKLAES